MRHTPLHDAVVENNLIKIEKLVKAGANVNLRTSSFSYTPLHLACTGECAEILLKLGADHKLTDEHGKTPMKVAQIENRIDVMKTLKAHEILGRLIYILIGL